MTRRRWIALCLCVAAAIGFGLYVYSLREPSWEGRTLSEWLEDVERPLFARIASPEVEHQKSATALKAIESMGADALPTLRSHLDESSLRVRFETLLQKQPFIVITNVPAETRLRRALLACSSLGKVAASAVPEIISCLHNDEENVRILAALALGDICSQPQIAIPALIEALDDDEAAVRGNAASSLGDFAEAARPAIPALLNAAKVRDAYDRVNAAIALAKIAPETASDIIPTTIAKVKGDLTYSSFREALIIARAYGIHAKAYLPTLRRLLEGSSDPQTKKHSGDLLNQLSSLEESQSGTNPALN